MFDEAANPEIDRLIDQVQLALEGMGKVMVSLPLWKIHPKLSKNYSKMADGLDEFLLFSEVCFLSSC